jgi:hypothetical protein
MRVIILGKSSSQIFQNLPAATVHYFFVGFGGPSTGGSDLM